MGPLTGYYSAYAQFDDLNSIEHSTYLGILNFTDSTLKVRFSHKNNLVFNYRQYFIYADSLNLKLFLFVTQDASGLSKSLLIHTNDTWNSCNSITPGQTYPIITPFQISRDSASSDFLAEPIFTKIPNELQIGTIVTQVDVANYKYETDSYNSECRPNGQGLIRIQESVTDKVIYLKAGTAQEYLFEELTNYGTQCDAERQNFNYDIYSTDSANPLPGSLRFDRLKQENILYTDLANPIRQGQYEMMVQIKIYNAPSNQYFPGSSSQYFTIIVTPNDPPYFPLPQLPDFICVVGVLTSYPLQTPLDGDKDKLSLSFYNMPEFISFDSNTLNCETQQYSSREYLMKVVISDPVNDVAYPLRVVLQFDESQLLHNDAISARTLTFKGMLKNVTIKSGMTSIIQLPSVSGKWVSIEVDLSGIPMGMGRFNQKYPSSSFQFTPNSHQIGTYRIGITLIDNMFPMKTRKVEYSFLVTVLLQEVKEAQQNVNFSIPVTASNSTKSKQVQIVTIENVKCTRDQQLTVLLSKCGKPGIILDMLFNQSKPFQLTMPSQDSLNISYNLIKSDPEKPSFTIQLSYSNPSHVSASTELDQVQLTILKTIQFEDETFKIILQKKTSTLFKVQPVMTESKTLNAYFVCRGSQVDTEACRWGHICDLSINQVLANKQSKIVFRFIPGSLIVNISLQYSQIYLTLDSSMVIQLIWAFLNDISFLMILSLISLPMPGLAQLLQSAILNLIQLDILFTDKYSIILQSKVSNNMIRFKILLISGFPEQSTEMIKHNQNHQVTSLRAMAMNLCDSLITWGLLLSTCGCSLALMGFIILKYSDQFSMILHYSLHFQQQSES